MIYGHNYFYGGMPQLTIIVPLNSDSNFVTFLESNLGLELTMFRGAQSQFYMLAMTSNSTASTDCLLQAVIPLCSINDDRVVRMEEMAWSCHHCHLKFRDGSEQHILNTITL